jgi:hypothetical protein
MTRIKYDKIIILCLSIALMFIIYYYVEKPVSAIIWMGSLLVVLWIYGIISKSLQQSRKK